jgi:hypothetical protein
VLQLQIIGGASLTATLHIRKAHPNRWVFSLQALDTEIKLFLLFGMASPMPKSITIIFSQQLLKEIPAWDKQTNDQLKFSALSINAKCE